MNEKQINCPILKNPSLAPPLPHHGHCSGLHKQNLTVKPKFLFIRFHSYIDSARKVRLCSPGQWPCCGRGGARDGFLKIGQLISFSFKRRFPSLKTLVSVHLAAPLSTRFSIKNAKSVAVFFWLVGHFFFLHHWIQLTKLHQNGGSQLNLKISISIAPP